MPWGSGHSFFCTYVTTNGYESELVGSQECVDGCLAKEQHFMRIFRPAPATGARRLGLLPLVLSAVCLCRADTVYSVNLAIGTASVTGFIETDGTTGPYYQGAAMVDWNLMLSSGGSTFNLLGPLSGSNSIASISDLFGHGMLSATATQLLYNFNAGYGGVFHHSKSARRLLRRLFFGVFR